MKCQIQGFTKVEFLLILISIAYGFCIVEILTNWTRIVRRGNYWETLLWSVNLFLGISFLWYNAWGKIHLIQDNAGYYMLSLVPSAGFFVLVSLLFPDSGQDWHLEQRFIKNRKMFFLILGLVAAALTFLSMVGSTQSGLISGARLFLAASCLVLYWLDSKILRAVIGTITISWYAYIFFLSGI
jgi:hypothetical protein